VGGWARSTMGCRPPLLRRWEKAQRIKPGYLMFFFRATAARTGRPPFLVRFSDTRAQQFGPREVVRWWEKRVGRAWARDGDHSREHRILASGTWS
jgi:hypothetical protein